MEAVYLRHQSHCNPLLHFDAKRYDRGDVSSQRAPGQIACDQTGKRLRWLHLCGAADVAATWTNQQFTAGLGSL